MKYWLDKDSESSNVIVVNDSTIFIGSCDKEAYQKVEQQLANKNNPIEVLGTDDLTAIPFSQIQNLCSRNTDRDVDISYKAKKETEEKTLYFNEAKDKQEFISSIDLHRPEHLIRGDSEQSALGAAINPLISLALSLSTIFLFINKFRWPVIIIGSIWALISIYMLLSRIKEPPTVTTWTIKGRYVRKLWGSIKTGFSYVVLAAIIAATHQGVADSYGPKSIYAQMQDDSLSSYTVDELLARGADINYRDQHGNSALSLALDWAEDDIAITLIESGADLSIKDGDERSAIELAFYMDSSATVIETMLNNGASLNFTIDGVSPLEYARETENPQLQVLLSEHLDKA